MSKTKKKTKATKLLKYQPPYSPDALVGIRLKLKRAWQQLNVLKREMGTFIDARPYRPAVEFNSQTKRLTFKVEVHGVPDPMWGVLVGEIVHNFRSALDHVVWELAGRPPARTSKTQFPIFDTPAGFSARGLEQFLAGVEDKAITLIKAEQPFFVRPDGTCEGTTDSPLWHLKELSDIDKHRTLHLVGTTLDSHQFTPPKVVQPFTPRDVQEHSGGPIQQDTVLWTAILHGAKGWPFAEGDTDVRLGVEIAFEDGTPAPGVWSVIGTLVQLGNRAERILRRVATDILKTEL
jgi:hypothetical protein